ncbi:MAG: hypothetical protein AAF708_05875 [Deinococcota bacterium]
MTSPKPSSSQDLVRQEGASSEGASLEMVLTQPLSRKSLADARHYLAQLRHPANAFLLFRWLLRGSWAITKHEVGKRIDYGRERELAFQDEDGDTKVSVPVNYAAGITVFFPVAALILWLFTQLSSYQFEVVPADTQALTEADATLPLDEGVS